MIIECENLKLQLITEADLEQVREWRNALHVNQQMEYREMIQPEDQRQWFSSLDKRKNFYFKILISGEAIGVIHLKNIDWESGSAEAGIFVGKEDHIGTLAPILSVFVMMKVAFDGFQLKELYAKISKKNHNALKFNQELGYQLYAPAGEGFDRFICTKESFHSPLDSVSKIHQLINRNASIKFYIGKELEWLLPRLQVEGTPFQFYLL